MLKRRSFLKTFGVVSTLGTTGCITDKSGDEKSTVQDSDGDGVIDSEDYAPNDPAVQEKSDVQVEESTERQTSQRESTEQETDRTQFEVSVSKKFTPPSAPGGLTWDGSHLWFGSSDYQESGNLYKIGLEGRIENTYTIEKMAFRGLAYDGDYLWACGKYTHDDHDYSPWVVRISTTGEITKEYEPEFFPTGCTWGDGGLWMCPEIDTRIVKYEPRSSLEQRFSLGGNAERISGIAFDGENYYAGRNIIYKYNQQNTESAQKSNIPDQYTIRGLAYIDERNELWGASFDEDAMLKVAVI